MGGTFLYETLTLVKVDIRLEKGRCFSGLYVKDGDEWNIPRTGSGQVRLFFEFEFE